MKFNAVRAMLITSLVIILMYILGLFLPIIKNSKEVRNWYRKLKVYKGLN